MALSKFQKLAYGFGHVLNDLCASMWFTYLLVYFHKVIGFSNSMAGNIMLAGQISDGLSTPILGYLSDRKNLCCRYGRRKSWHMLGTICVIVAYPLLFTQCVFFNENTPEWLRAVYYATLAASFTFGWASTQVNHLALIPDLTNDIKERVTLNSFRYGFTVFSRVVVYGLAWLYLQLPQQEITGNYPNATTTQGMFTNTMSISTTHSYDQISNDAAVFRNLVLTVVGIGVIFSASFHVGLKEKPTFPQPSHGNGKIPTSIPEEESRLKLTECNHAMKWYDWFKKPSFYQMAALYMCTRLVVNLSQVYMPMYLTETLHLHKTYIAIVPLIIYVSGFIAAIIVRPIISFLKQEAVYAGGAIFVVGACVWAHFLEEQSMLIYGMSVMFGLGTSVIFIMSLSMTSTLIGLDTATGAFVYGAMSLLEKLSNGAAVVIIQNINPCSCHDCSNCDWFYRSILSYLVGGITMLALFIIVSRTLIDRLKETCSSDVSSAGDNSSIQKKTSYDNLPQTEEKITDATKHFESLNLVLNFDAKSTCLCDKDENEELILKTSVC